MFENYAEWSSELLIFDVEGFDLRTLLLLRAPYICSTDGTYLPVVAVGRGSVLAQELLGVRIDLRAWRWAESLELENHPW